MRRILFKAKKLSDGKWVKGSLVKTPFGTFIEWYEDSICNKGEVNPDTVCQSTGLVDCKGNEVWEGDIVEFETFDLYKGIIKIKGIIGYISSGFFAVVDDIPYPLNSKCIKVVDNKFDKEK